MVVGSSLRAHDQSPLYRCNSIGLVYALTKIGLEVYWFFVAVQIFPAHDFHGLEEEEDKMSLAGHVAFNIMPRPTVSIMGISRPAVSIK